MPEEDDEHMRRRLVDSGRGAGFPAADTERDSAKMDPSGYRFQFPGFWRMTLRQWYAGQAMEGLLAQPNRTDDMPILAKIAFRAADALITFEMNEKGL